MTLGRGGNSLLSMVIMLSMSFCVAVAGGLRGAFGSADAGPGHLDTLDAFRGTFVCTASSP